MMRPDTERPGTGQRSLGNARSARPRRALHAIFCISVASTAAYAQDTALQVKTQQIEGPSCAAVPVWQNPLPPAPCRDEELQQWLVDARHWRQERRIRVGYDDAAYRRPELAWTQSNFVQPQMMVQDRFFYDPATSRYTVDRYIDDLDARYGGIDSVLVWPTYPNLGIDDRNQYDLLRDLPGGEAGIRQFVADFHARNVKVLFPVMLWDQGTRDENASDAEAMARNMKTFGADGINGDTLDGIPAVFRDRAEALGHPLALEPELGPSSDEMLNWNQMSWGYWDYSFVPMVSRFKWIEPRHMVNVSDRFAHNHTDDLQHAFFNGTGFESWENIWGIWNGITPRNAEALRRVATIERFAATFLTSQEWQPFASTRHYGVFASRWPNQDATLWTIVNRNHYPVGGPQLLVPHEQGMHYYDLWSGVEIEPAVGEGGDMLSFDIEADGFGAVLATDRVGPAIATLLQQAKSWSKLPLGKYANDWSTLTQHLVPIAPTKPASAAPSGMSYVPGTQFLFRVNGIEIEGGDDEGVDVQYPGEPSARRYHETTVPIAPFWIDTTPVTNAAFKQFIDTTHYHPADDHNFLRDWKDGHFPVGWADKPVTWVSIEDARAYAVWAGKRLPHEWEWQYAAQGEDGRAYPWGDALVAANMPTPDTGRTMLAASGVHTHPGGASPFGVLDMVGNVWQWTDEWSDTHTRAAILRGGSHYRPSGARWYFPQALPLSQHGKYLLMAPSIDRSGAIGFRCVMDG